MPGFFVAADFSQNFRCYRNPAERKGRSWYSWYILYIFIPWIQWSANDQPNKARRKRNGKPAEGHSNPVFWEKIWLDARRPDQKPRKSARKRCSALRKVKEDIETRRSLLQPYQFQPYQEKDWRFLQEDAPEGCFSHKPCYICVCILISCWGKLLTCCASGPRVNGIFTQPEINDNITYTHTHWYPSHLQMKDQGRKLSCKNDRLQQFLCLLVLLLDT